MNQLQKTKTEVQPEVATQPDSNAPPADSRIASIFFWIKNFFDYLGASREEPPIGASFLASPWWLGLWWGLLIGLILLFCGQTSKFIYIDF
jgi:hypothetical protein